MHSTPTRRSFLRSSTTAAAASLCAPNLLPSQDKRSQAKLNIACIGAMGAGRLDRLAIQSTENIVAICDVDSLNLAKAAKDSPNAKLYADFRTLFAEMGDGIDAVLVSTPAHSHFPIAMAALRAGKHVCVQPPLSNRIWEARELQKAAQEKDLITQMANQGRTKQGGRIVKEWISQGAIGKLAEIQLWTDHPTWPQGPALKRVNAPPPDHLDWTLWQSQVPDKPYSEGIHPSHWRAWWDYGSGALGDRGPHLMDASFSVLDGALPSKIDVEAGPSGEESAPGWSSLVYHFQDGPILGWYDGKKDGQPNRPAKPDELASLSDAAWKKATSGMLFIGEKGAIFSSDPFCSTARIYPQERMAEVQQMLRSGKILPTEKRSTHPGEPQKEWVHAIKNGLGTSSPFEYSAPLTEWALLGNLALRAGESISWDPDEMTTGNEIADEFVRRESYREGWDPTA